MDIYEAKMAAFVVSVKFSFSFSIIVLFRLNSLEHQVDEVCLSMFILDKGKSSSRSVGSKGSRVGSS